MPLSLNKTCPCSSEVSRVSPEPFSANLVSSPCQTVWHDAKSNLIILGSAEDALLGLWLAMEGVEALLKQRGLYIYPALPRDLTLRLVKLGIAEQGHHIDFTFSLLQV